MPQTLLPFALALCAIALVYAAYRLYLAWRLSRAYTEIKSRGLPTTLAELDAWHARPPETENAAPLLTEVHDILISDKGHTFSHEFLESLPDGGAFLSPSIELPDCVTDDLPPDGRPLPKSRRRALAQYFNEQDEALDLLHGAAQRSRFRSSIEYTKWPASASVNELHSAHKGVELLSARAALAATLGKPHDAAKDVLAAVALSRLVGQEPTIIAQLARATTLTTALNALGWSLNACAFSDPHLAALQRSLHETERVCALGRAFAAERCLVRGESTANEAPAQKESTLQEETKMSNVLKEHYRSLDEDRAIFQTTGMDVDAELASLGKQIREAEEWERAFEEHEKELEKGMTETERALMDERKSPSSLLSRLIGLRTIHELRWLRLCDDLIDLSDLPLDEAPTALREFRRDCELNPYTLRTPLSIDVLNCILGDICDRTRARLARIAIAAERFQRKHGAYPESIQQLLPAFLDAVPTDPFLPNEPISYARTRHGHALVWSAGPTPEERHAWVRPPDLQFRVGLKTDVSAE